MLFKSNIVGMLLGSVWGKCWRVGVVFPWDQEGGNTLLLRILFWSVSTRLNQFECVSDRVSVGDHSTVIFPLAGLEGCQHRIGHRWKNDI